MPFFSATFEPASAAWILLAAGSSIRYGAGRSKLLEPLGSGRVIDRTILSLSTALPGAPIILVSASDLRDAIGWNGAWTPGGRRRQDSAAAGLATAAALVPRPLIALIHDAARPLVSAALVARLISGFETLPIPAAVAPALPVFDTIKRVRDGLVLETLERSSLAALQTPQAVRLDAAISAFEAAAGGEREFTDDLAVLEAVGLPTRITEGDPSNLKITTPADLARAAALLEAWTG